MRKFYLIRARLINSAGDEARLIWKIRRAWFWESPVDIVTEYVNDAAKNYPQLGFDLIEMKEI